MIVKIVNLDRILVSLIRYHVGIRQSVDVMLRKWLVTAKSTASSASAIPVVAQQKGLQLQPPSQLSFTTQQMRDQPWNFPKRIPTDDNTSWRSKSDVIFNKRRFADFVDEMVSGCCYCCYCCYYRYCSAFSSKFMIWANVVPLMKALPGVLLLAGCFGN